MMSDGNFICRVPGCMGTFKYRNQRIRHEKKSHDTSELEANRPRPIVCGRLCGICGEMVKDIYLLCAHVENSHGIQARIITKEFSSELEFNAWKSDIHQTSSAEFFTAKSEKGRAMKLLLCHRTGSYQPIGGTSGNSRAPRETPTIKIGFDCTAFISVKQVDGKFIARACLDHYGHTMDPKLLHLDASTQAKVVQMLKEDRRPAWIVKEIRSKGKGREKLIRTQDIWNIRYHKINHVTKTAHFAHSRYLRAECQPPVRPELTENDFHGVAGQVIPNLYAEPVPKPVEDSTDTISEKVVSALKKLLVSVESGEVRDKTVLIVALEKVNQVNSLIETVGQSTAFKAQKKVRPGQNFDHQRKYKWRRKEKKVLDDSFEEEII